MRMIFDDLDMRISEKSDIILYVVHDYEDKVRLSKLLDKHKYKVVTLSDVSHNGIVGFRCKEYKVLNRIEVDSLIKEKEYVINE